MATTYAAAGDLLDIAPVSPALAQAHSGLLIRAEHLEVFRLVLPAGKRTPGHSAAGAITIQCLAGRVELETGGRTQVMSPGTLVYLADAQPHAVEALEDAALLITVMLRRA